MQIYIKNLVMCPEANVPLQGRQASRGCIPDTPGETGLHLEWKQRTPLCSRVATGISWSSLTLSTPNEDKEAGRKPGAEEQVCEGKGKEDEKHCISGSSDMYACTHAKSLQSRLAVCDPMDCSPPGSSVHGILQAGILEWVAMPSSRGSS